MYIENISYNIVKRKQTLHDNIVPQRKSQFRISRSADQHQTTTTVILVFLSPATHRLSSLLIRATLSSTSSREY